jgi:(1->4)-alpha-D-glucan 1-alpha-D-glucosylmutase
VPAEWDVAGTSGYDFMDEVSALQHDGTAEPVLAAIWEAVSGRSRAFEREEVAARREILRFAFAGQYDRLVDTLLASATVIGITDIPSRQALARAVELILSEMRAYRSYATAGAPVAGPFLDRALDRARAAVLRDDTAIDLVAAVMSGPEVADADGIRDAAMRQFNQLSAPLAAKAVEDTAFYRYGRLLSRNDVGFHAAELAMPPTAFHERMANRARILPHSLLATATHDHKRGEDVRARLAVLSELPERLAIDAGEWLARAAETGQSLDPADAYLILQMIIGAWDPALDMADVEGCAALADRLCGWMTKALREGKLRSSWTSPDEVYEGRANAFIHHVLVAPEAIAARACIGRLLTATMTAGAANGLVQTALRLTLPGVPDTYQGTEFWDFSLVDPDNRRPVDFAARLAALSGSQDIAALCANWRDGRIKQALIQRLLRLRQSDPQLFAKGDYQAVETIGTRSAHCLAFLRRSGNRGVLVAVGRLLASGLAGVDEIAPNPDWWGDTALDLSGLRLSRRMTIEPVVGPAQTGSALPLGDIFAGLPVAVWKVSGL